jgi:FkbM family methyltransferase
MKLNKLINKLIRPLHIGYYRESGWSQIKDLEVPDYIVDIGVAEGTPYLYKTFKNSEFILVDPLRESKKFMDLSNKRPSKYKFYEYAMGSNAGKVTINVEENIARSSVLSRTSESDSGLVVDRRTVNVITGEDLFLIAEIYNSSVGIKIDTEGYELEIIKGFMPKSDNIKWFICETSVIKRFNESYNFSELVCYMNINGFEISAVLNGAQDKDGVVRLLDVVFTNVNYSS